MRIHTWYWSKGRSSITMAHEMFEGDSQKPIARGMVTLVCTDFATMKSAPIKFPPDLRVYPSFQDLGQPSLKLTESPPPNAYEYHVTVRPSDLDMNVHVNQSVYLDFYEDARYDAVQNNGYGDYTTVAQGNPRQVLIEYDREAYVNDRLIIQTWKVQNMKGCLGFYIYKADEQVVDRKPVGKCIMSMEDAGVSPKM
eukprot:TRINITY_DN7947_c0_g1_i1.p1 TRINITY_DN7947_c0_g1~~TRINITY_DN7947_c0_g1_i1.p1  ORF type:complete len:196 (-),score=29.53 TRINITY_DN7947_c0_g1_i1:126-713(-)